MQQPLGFESENESLVCKLKKAICGLKHTPKAWFECLVSALQKFGFHATRCVSSLFIHCQTPLCFNLCRRKLLTGNDVAFISSLKQKLNSEFALKDLSLLTYFLGVEVTYAPDDTIHLSQNKYI